MPVAALASRRWRCSACSSRSPARNPLEVYAQICPGRVRHLVFVAEHAAARGAADADGAVRGAAGAAGLVVIGGEGALVLGGLAAAVRGHALIGMRAARGRCSAMALAGMVVGGALDRARGRAARVPRRQRDHQQPAAQLHRDRAVQPPGRGAAARSGQPEQAVDAADRRRQHARRRSRPRTCTGAWCFGVVVCVAVYVLMRAHDVRASPLRMVGGNVRAALLAGLPVGRAGPSSPAPRRRRAPAWPAWSRWRRCTAAPTRRWSPATATPASWSRSSRATTRSPIMPVAILLGGIGASGGLLQRRFELPDATVSVLQGIAVHRRSWRARPLYGRRCGFSRRLLLAADPQGGRMTRARLVGRAARRARRRDPRQHAVPVRQPGRVPDREEPAA